MNWHNIRPWEGDGTMSPPCAPKRRCRPFRGQRRHHGREDMLKITAVIIAIVLGVLAAAPWITPSREYLLERQLDRLEQIESARLSAICNATVRVTVTVDRIEPS